MKKLGTREKIDFDKVKTEKLGSICLKIIDSFLSKNIANLNEEFLGMTPDNKKSSESKFYEALMRLRYKINETADFKKFILKHNRNQVVRNMN